MLNNKSVLDNCDERVKNVTINSIDRIQYVARLPNYHAANFFSFENIIPYGYDNLYPQKIKSIAQRSGTTISAIGTLSNFIAGEGFEGLDTVVNREGSTLWDILRHITSEYSMFGGYALHFNYDLNGVIAEINPINFEFLRIRKDMKKLVMNKDWERNGLDNNEIEYDFFNPQQALRQIEVIGISEYKGQILYWRPRKKDIYNLTLWDSVLDDAQFEAEAKLYSLSNIQNDFSLSGVFAYPKPLETLEEIKDIKKDLRGDMGSANAGGIKVVGFMPNSDMAGHKWFYPISRNNVDGLFKQQKEDAKMNIYHVFRQPPILNGVSTTGMFNEESYTEAFNYYNSQVESERKDIERILNNIIKSSIWSNLFPVNIKPKTFISSGGDSINNA